MHSRGLFILLLCISLGWLSSCIQEGILEVTLDLELQETTLNPLTHPSLSSFTLTVSTENYTDKATEYYYSGRRRLDFGKIAVGMYRRIGLTASSFFGATLAYGEVFGNFKIDAKNSTHVEIPLRYPFVYASGGYGLPPLHPELDSSMALFMNIPVGVSPETTSAVAVSPDGTLLVTTTDDHQGNMKLWVLLTRNHKKLIDTSISRPDSVDSIAFSPDGKMLSLLSFSGGWVAFLNIDSLLAGNSDIVFIDIDQPLRGVFVDNQNFVILQSVPYNFARCDSTHTSQLVWLIVNRSPMEAQLVRSIPLNDYASSVAVDISTRRVYASLTCRPEIVVMEAGAVQTVSLLSELNLSPCLRPVQLAVGQSDLLVACATSSDTTSAQWAPAKILVQRYTLRPQLNPNSRSLVMDYPWEPFVLNKDNNSNNEAALVLQLAPTRLLPRAIGLTAAASRMMLVVEAYHYTKPFQVELNPTSSIYINETSVKSHSVVFVDARVAQMGRRIRTACFPVKAPDDNTMPAGLAPDKHCSLNAGMFDVTPVSFIPTQVAIMFAAP